MIPCSLLELSSTVALKNSGPWAKPDLGVGTPFFSSSIVRKSSDPHESRASVLFVPQSKYIIFLRCLVLVSAGRSGCHVFVSVRLCFRDWLSFAEESSRQALITFSMPGIWYTEDIRDGHVFNSTATGRRVHLLLAECAPKLRKLPFISHWKANLTSVQQ